MIKQYSIARWLQREFGDVTRSGQDVRVDCPFCSEPDTKQHLYVNIAKPVAHCFRCDWSGTHFQLVREIVGAESYAEVVHHLQGTGSRTNISGYQSVADRLKSMFVEGGSRPKLALDMPEWFKSFNANERITDPHASVVLDYALQRLTVNSIIWHDVGYCTSDDPMLRMLRWRVVFPVENGFWQARTIGRSTYAKYISPQMEKGDVLFNYVALDRHPELYVAEGIISALALGPSAVAVIGKGATEAQAKRIAKSQVGRVTIAFDAGTEFSKGVTQLADVLVSHGKDVIIRQYTEGDPDSCHVFTEEPYSMKYRVFAGLYS